MTKSFSDSLPPPVAASDAFSCCLRAVAGAGPGQAQALVHPGQRLASSRGAEQAGRGIASTVPPKVALAPPLRQPAAGLGAPGHPQAPPPAT